MGKPVVIGTSRNLYLSIGVIDSWEPDALIDSLSVVLDRALSKALKGEV